MKQVYQCENCEGTTEYRWWIFHCLWCGKEICEDCMYSWMTCKECAADKSDELLEIHFGIYGDL